MHYLTTLYEKLLFLMVVLWEEEIFTGTFELIITSGQLIYNYNIHGIAKKICQFFW